MYEINSNYLLSNTNYFVMAYNKRTRSYVNNIKKGDKG